MTPKDPAHEEAKINRDIRRLFIGTPLGKKVLEALMLRNYVFSGIAELAPPDSAYHRGVLAGRQALVLEILQTCRGRISVDDFIDADAAATREALLSQQPHDPTEGL